MPHWADADDIAQEVRIRLWEQFDNYDPAKDFSGWARTIAYYQVLTHRERQSRRRGMIGDRFVELVAEEVAAISDELDASDRALKDCFEKLPQAKRDLLLRYYSGERSTRKSPPSWGAHSTPPGRRFSAPARRSGIASMKHCTGRAADEQAFSPNSDPLRREVYELADALLSGSLAAEEAQRLERLVSSDPNALRHYVRFMHNSATLSQWGRDSSGAESSERPVDVGN